MATASNGTTVFANGGPPPYALSRVRLRVTLRCGLDHFEDIHFFACWPHGLHLCVLHRRNRGVIHRIGGRLVATGGDFVRHRRNRLPRVWQVRLLSISGTQSRGRRHRRDRTRLALPLARRAACARIAQQDFPRACAGSSEPSAPRHRTLCDPSSRFVQHCARDHRA